MKISAGLALPVLLAALVQVPAAEKRTLVVPVNAVGTGGVRVATECAIPTGPPVPVSALAFHPDNQHLASGGYQEVLVWDLSSARLIKRIGPLAQRIHALAFSRDGRSLAVAEGTPGIAGRLRVVDFESGQVNSSLWETKDELLAVAFSPDGKLLAAGGVEGQVRVFSLEQGKAPVTLNDHAGWVTGVAFSPSGKFFVSSSSDRTVRVYETGEWKIVASVPQPLSDPVHALSFSPDDELLAFAVGGVQERAVRLWRTASVKETAESTAIPKRDTTKITRPIDVGPGMPMAVAWTPAVQGPKARPSRFYSAGTGGYIRVNNSNGAFVANLSGHQDWVYALAASPDGARLASGSGDGTVKVWSAADNVLLATLIQVAPQSNEWVILTSKGHFTATSAVAESLRWKVVNPNVTPEELTVRLQDPDAVRSALAAKPTR